MSVGNFLKVLEYYNTKNIIDNGDSYRMCCPIHNGANPTSFVLRKDNGLFYCHAGCGGGDVITFIEKMENVGFEDAINKLADILEINVDEIETKQTQSLLQENTKKWIEYVNKFAQPLNIQEYKMPDVKLYNVKSFRNFTKETIEHFKLKYAKTFPIKKSNGKASSLDNRLVFPLYFNDTLIGVSLRRVNNNDFPKWLHQPPKIITGQMLYNYDNIVPFQPIGVVEGILDVWKYYQIGITNVVATFGANLTKEQERLLIKKTDTIWLSYDNDEAGHKATNKAINKLRYKANLKRIILPENKDPCDVDDEELLVLYNNMERVI